jgi:hypothetical protein
VSKIRTLVESYTRSMNHLEERAAALVSRKKYAPGDEVYFDSQEAIKMHGRRTVQSVRAQVIGGRWMHQDKRRRLTR